MIEKWGAIIPDLEKVRLEFSWHRGKNGLEALRFSS